MSCYKVQLGSKPICAEDGTPLKSGTRPRLLLANLEDIVSVTTSATTPNLITAITFASNTVGYIFEGFKQEMKPTQEFVVANRTMYKHALNFVVHDITQIQKNNIQKIAGGRLVAICENLGKNADSFEIYGLNSGLEVVPGVARDPYANSGGYLISLATPETEPEVLLPQTLFTTDYATTLALVDEYAGLPTITVISDVALQVAGGDSETITGTNFYGNGASSVVLSMQWVNQVTGALVSQTGLTVVSDTSITFTSVALTAGSYRLRVTTTRGVADSVQIAVAS